MTAPTLPPLSDDRVDAMERTVFARISDERRAARARRTKIWGWSGAAAAVVVLAVVLAPGITANVASGGSRSSDGAFAPTVIDGAAIEGGVVDGSAVQGAAGDAPLQSAEGLTDAATGARDIVATGSSTVEVDDVRTAVSKITDATTAAGGYVESSQVGNTNGVVPLEGDAPAVDASSAWITVRVPAESLGSVMDGLASVGDVTATSVSRSDVTDQAVDLRARVAAAEASVTRLTELVSQAASVADLITAESALSERQAQLDADRQQLELLESQVSMSSLTVQIVARSAAVAADPAGFGDGLSAGWNGVIATLNGVVVALGFLLPWIAIAAVIFTVIWGVRRLVRRRAVRED